MKKLTIIIAVALFATQINAQVTYSCDYSKTCTTDKKGEKTCGDWEEDFALFEFNKAETILKLTDSTGEYTFSIREKTIKGDALFIKLLSFSGKDYWLIILGTVIRLGWEDTKTNNSITVAYGIYTTW